jgi:hypothetical protein
MDERQLAGWVGPSSDTEEAKMERTVRMVREAIVDSDGFAGEDILVFAKGSYPNHTNVRYDSDVDVAVQCREVFFSDGKKPTTLAGGYNGPWTPDHLRAEVRAALVAKFGSQVNSSGTTAIRVNSSTARVEADVVPCFSYRYYLSADRYRQGIKIFSTDGRTPVNYPTQCLENGRAKNVACHTRYKKVVRILKRCANAMEVDGRHKAVPSYLVECLVYNCPDSVFGESTWTNRTRRALIHIWNELEGEEPTYGRWLETNECNYLFHAGQAWTRTDSRAFAKAAWNFLGFA